MPAGSAASLPLPQGPLSPTLFARRRRFKALPQEAGAPAAPMPLHKPAEHPPRRRVLVAWNDSTAALRLQRLLGELGYRMIGPAGSRDEAERLIRRPLAARPAVDVALVHVALPEAAEIADRLAGEAVPLVWMMPDRGVVLPAMHAHAPILERPLDRAALAAAIEEAERHEAARRQYPIPPPQAAWPRIFPQL